MVIETTEWRDRPGGAVRGRQILRACAWTAFVGLKLSSSRGRIVDVMLMCDWPCLLSLARTALCPNTFAPLLRTDADCTFALQIASEPPCFGPRGWLISSLD